MKTLILIRHAKSSWSDLTISDFDRKLDDRGKRDAPIMAARLRQKEILIDTFVSSPARRASKTAKIFMKEYDAGKKHLILNPRIYEASLQTLFEVVESLNDDWDTVALFGHNPGLTDLSSHFSGQLLNMPTCAIVGVEIDSNNWSEFRAADAKIFLYDFPKNQE